MSTPGTSQFNKCVHSVFLKPSVVRHELEAVVKLDTFLVALFPIAGTAHPIQMAFGHIKEINSILNGIVAGNA